MKKLFSALGIFTFALVLIGFVAPKASAAALTGVTDTPSSYIAGTASTTQTIVFTTATIGAIKSIDIVFPAGYNVSGAGIGTYTPTDSEATPVVTAVSQTVTVTFGTASAGTISKTYTLPLTLITNTSTSGNTTVTVTTKNASSVAIDTGTSGNILIVPAAVSNLTCEASGQGGAVWLRWTTPTGTSAGYVVQYIQGNAITWDSGTTTFAQTWTSGTVGSAQQQLLTGLNPNTQYTFATKANGGNSSVSAVSTLTPICYAPGSSPAVIDTQAPITHFVSPKTNATVLAGQPLVIQGVSKDVGKSSVQKVEISLDGVTWNLANAIANDTENNLIWNYTWAAPTVGAITIQARASDWMGNTETPVSLPITVANTLPTAVTPAVPATPAVPGVSPAVPATPAAPAQAVRHAYGRSLRFGELHDEVMELQKFLNANGYAVSASGAGSAGKETKYFGPATRKALMQYQKDHNLPATGFFGPMTRALFNK